MGGEALREQLLLALEILARELEVRHLGADIGHLGRIAALHLRDLQTRGADGGLRLHQGDAEGLGVDAVEKVALLHLLIFSDVDVRDPPADLRRDVDDMRDHLGIVGRDRSSARHPEIEADQRQDDGHREHQHRPQPAALPLDGFGIRHVLINFANEIHATSL